MNFNLPCAFRTAQQPILYLPGGRIYVFDSTLCVRKSDRPMSDALCIQVPDAFRIQTWLNTVLPTDGPKSVG